MLLYKSGLNKYLSNAKNCRRQVKFSDITTYGLGGGIKECYFPKTPYQAKLIYGSLKSEDKNIAVLGNGSNVLASDNDFNGAVICLREMCGIVRVGENKITCLAGTKISTILKYCKNNHLSGLEYMYGIPASVGGAAFMNAGIGKYSISQNIVNIDYCGVFCGKIGVKQCKFGYRQSTMRNMNGLILAVTLNLKPASVEEINEKIDYFKLRRAHLPKGRSCGCVFKNGENYSSGELIDKAGLKGERCGGVYIPLEHANFIINNGGSADDVKKLIEIVKLRVKEKFGIDLQEEVVYIGDF